MGKEKSPETLIANDTLTKKLTSQVVIRSNNIYKGEESFSSKFDKLDAIQRQISEVDTISEISHTLTHDDDENIRQSDEKQRTVSHNTSSTINEEKDSTAVKAIVHAQDIIAKTQKEHFDNILTCLEKH